MQVSMESLGGLKRRLTVMIPPDLINSQVDRRANEVAKTAKIDGFRPGKVPLTTIKKRFGDSLLHEALSELIRKTFDETVTERSLALAGAPNIDAKPHLEPNKPFEYHAEFEVLPEFTLLPFTGEIDKFITQITDQDIETAIERTRKQQATWQTVQRTAKEGDKVTLDYQGTMNGKPFVGGSANDVPIILGTKTMIPGFEEGLLGAAVGETRVLSLTFPADYNHKDYAGKAAEFSVTIKSIEEPILPALDENFFKQFGLADTTIEGLRQLVRQHLEGELARVIKNKERAKVVTQLLSTYQFDVPEVMVKGEVARLKQAALQQFSQSEKVDPSLLDQLPDDLYREQAQKNVQTGLIISKFIKERGIQVDAASVRKVITDMAQGFGDPEKAIAWYYSNPEQLNLIQYSVLEDQVMDQLLSEATRTDKVLSFDELLKQ